MKNQDKNQIRRKIYFFFLLSILVFLLNHFLKILALQKKCFIFCFSAVTNFGAAFSLFDKFFWVRFITIFIALIVIILAIYYYFRFSEKSILLRWALPLIFIGTLSNMLDRIILGYVVDYIPFFSAKLFVFNLADLSNFIGVILLIIFLLKRKK